MTTHTLDRDDGNDAAGDMITVSGRALTAVVDPRRGAKIVSLRDPRYGEWLAQADPSAAARRGAAFVDAEMAGWDECAPTIVACRVEGRELPDHGDLWDTAFEQGEDGVSLTAIGESLGYRFRRSIRPIETGLRLEYEATALHGPIPFLWAAHPQFAAPRGTRVELPTDVRRVIDVMDPALPVLDRHDDLTAMDTVPSGGYRKLYADPATPVHAARLVRPDGARLEMRWSDACPYLGIWFDHAVFSREPVIAIEPTTAYYDALDTAVRLRRAPVLRPGSPLNWWVEVSVPASSAPGVTAPRQPTAG